MIVLLLQKPQLTSIKTDIVNTYVDWAARRGFAVIDVNLPRHVVDPENSSQEYEPADDAALRTQEATLLLTYLWDNYIELGESTHVFLMGTNTGHGAIINWMKANEEIAQERVNGAISFVEDVPLQSCKSATSDDLATWYFRHSKVFVAHDHNFWHSDLASKTRKRFGQLKQSDSDSISDMLIAHKDAVLDYLGTKTADWSGIVEEEDAMDISNTDVATTSRLPPVGNFALSPRAGGPTNSNSILQDSSSPKGRHSRHTSPSKTKTPPIGNFALAPPTNAAQASRSPGR
jgi:histone deacetylase 6